MFWVVIQNCECDHCRVISIEIDTRSNKTQIFVGIRIHKIAQNIN